MVFLAAQCTILKDRVRPYYNARSRMYSLRDN
jgi:hypothetical protein